MGAVLLIGCEIRSYMRIGLGYLNTWVGMIGFAVGYLPYTIYFKEHEAFAKSTLMIKDYKVYQLISSDVVIQQGILLLWLALISAGLFWLVRLGSRNTGMKHNDLLHRNTEDLQHGIDAEAARNNGRVGGVMAPMPVPARA